jgi:hypothetical protein
MQFAVRVRLDVERDRERVNRHDCGGPRDVNSTDIGTQARRLLGINESLLRHQDGDPLSWPL